MMGKDYWIGLANDYVTAYRQTFGRVPTTNAIELALSVAEHETNNGRAWPGTNNFGAVQLRGLSASEMQAFTVGSIKAGDYTADRTGVLHVDTHPGPGGVSTPYPVWFAAFPDRVAGIAHFLKTLWRLSANEPDADGATFASLALAMYAHHYYEGRHQDDRPWVAVRPVPLSSAEQANVDEYAAGCQRAWANAAPALEGWTVPS
jgi:hypothetical protein